jgi:uncharacterized membrane protein
VNRQQIATLVQRLKRIDLEIIEKWFSQKFFRRDLSEIIVFLSVICYTAVLSYYAIFKYYSFNAYAWDLGIFNQSLWTTLHADKFLFSTVEIFINPTGSFFGTHFSPILFLVLPVYSLYSAPETLLVFQSFILALGAVPLYFFAKDALNKRVLAVTFSLAYLLYPPLHGVNSFDFHVQAFLPVLFFCVMYFLGKEKWPHYFLFLFLSLFVAENVPFIIVFIGLYCFWLYRKEIADAIARRTLNDKRVLIPVLTIVIAVVWRFFATWVQNSYFPVDPVYSQVFKAVDNWSVLGIQNDPVTLPLHVILNPASTIAAFSYDIYLKLLYILLLFAPLLFLSFDSGLTAITLVWLIPCLLSNYAPYYLIGTHFPAYIIAFIFLAAVAAVKKSVQRPLFPTLGAYAKNMLLVSFVFALVVSPLSPILANSAGFVFSFSDYCPPRITEHEELLHRIVDMVPSNASVLTQNNIFPHFSSRTNAYVYPIRVHLERAPPDAIDEYINSLINKTEYVLVDTITDNQTSTAIIEKIDDFGHYVTYAVADGIYLFKNNYPR